MLQSVKESQVKAGKGRYLFQFFCLLQNPLYQIHISNLVSTVPCRGLRKGVGLVEGQKQRAKVPCILGANSLDEQFDCLNLFSKSIRPQHTGCECLSSENKVWFFNCFVVEMCAGEKANPWPLTNQNEVAMWMTSHKKIVTFLCKPATSCQAS